MEGFHGLEILEQVYGGNLFEIFEGISRDISLKNPWENLFKKIVIIWEGVRKSFIKNILGEISG